MEGSLCGTCLIETRSTRLPRIYFPRWPKLRNFLLRGEQQSKGILSFKHSFFDKSLSLLLFFGVLSLHKK